MSIRRKSCEPCYKARRKCGLEYPVCVRCTKGGKPCHYVYPPQLDLSSPGESLDMSSSPSAKVVSTYDRKVPWAQPDSTSTSSLPIQNTGPHLLSQSSSIDYLEPFKGCDADWTWVVHQIRDLPLDFARHAETLFIHQALYGDDGTLPRPLRAAFGICAASSAALNERTRPVFFRAIDDEVAELLRRAPSSSSTAATTTTTPLVEDLARLQAAVLYQIIRLFQGGAEQRVVAERQEFLVRSYGLALLQRADAELQHGEGGVQTSWEAWLLEESVRRTVFVAFKLYTIYSHFRHGVCAETEALAMLPVSSSRPAGSWWSREAFDHVPPQKGLRRHAALSTTEIVTYGEFTQQWEVAPRGDIDAYEMIMLVGCKGLGRVSALIEHSRRDGGVA